ncbi:LysR family transcriptional regulator [Psychromonas algicola]|uniref:LysR family transcriptional regulator n=1 Tax=Psychromonas algicola TaxID=2555642 RepID=UPI0010675A33|nr:LysR family transcriptional regulator [Psychromonas sp. RZ5]TEW46444.1 LysR family transcriptional regulator [Psychromonas sp. RZ5]
MDTFDGLKAVIAVVQTGSFTAAGERLGLSKALVSKYVAQVEKQLGVRLFNRSTRRLALTEAGNIYYQDAMPLVESITQLTDKVSGAEADPSGLLRVSASLTFGDTCLAKALPEFLAHYPNLQVELQLSDRKVDMLEEGIDLVIRIGTVDDSTLVSKKINTFPLVLCASPDYLAQHGMPKYPDDIKQHNCIVDSNFKIGKQWPFMDERGLQGVMSINSNVSVNSPRSVKEFALAGVGIALVPKYIVEDALNNGSLQLVLPEYRMQSFSMYAVYPHRKYLAQKTRSFVDFLIENFSGKISL